MKINGACDFCDQPASTMLNHWVGRKWWHRWTNRNTVRTCTEHIPEAMVKVQEHSLRALGNQS